jgi:hypothetical protein
MQQVKRESPAHYRIIEDLREGRASKVGVLQLEADRLKKENSALSVAEIRAKLEKFPEVRGRTVRDVKIARPRENLSRRKRVPVNTQGNIADKAAKALRAARCIRR